MAIDYTKLLQYGSRASRTPSYDLTPEEEISLTRSLANKTLGGVSAAGNLLDIPGSMVRDVLAWENPLDQLLSPMSPQNRTSGRDLLEQYGMLGRNRKGLDWGDVGGFGVEVALDPFTWLSFGAGAVSRGGKAARAAGIASGDIARMASKKVGREVGKREARMITKLDDVLVANPAKRDAITLALGKGNMEAGKRLLQSEGDKALGSLMGFGLPFKQTTAIGSALGGTGVRAQKFARGVDKLGAAISGSAPYRGIASLFNRKLAGAATRVLQKAAPTLDKNIDQAVAVGRGETNKMFELQRQAGILTPEADANLRHLYETGTVDDLGPAAQALMADPNTTATPELLQKLTGRWDNARESVLVALGEEGAAPSRLRGPVKFFPRAFAKKFADLYKSKGKAAIEGAAGENMSRIDWLRDVPTLYLNRLGKDPSIKKVIDGTPDIPATVLEDIRPGQRGGSVQDVEKAIAEYVEKSGDAIPSQFWTKDEWVQRERLTKELTAQGGLTPEQIAAQVDEAIPGSDRYAKLAKWLSGLTPEHRDANIFGNSTAHDMQRFHNKTAQSLEKSKFASRILANSDDVLVEEPRWLEQAGEIGTAGRGNYVRLAKEPVPHVGSIDPIVKAGDWTDAPYDIGKITGMRNKDGTAIVELLDKSTKVVPLDALTPMRLTGAASITGSRTLQDVFGKLEMKLGNEQSGALKALWKRLNPDKPDNMFTPDERYALAHTRVKSEIADDLTRVKDSFKSPESVDVLGSKVRSATNLWKAFVTGTFRFHSRNTTSAVAQNILADTKSVPFMRMSDSIVRGGIDESGTLAKIPIIQETAAEWVKDGIMNVDPKNLSNEEATNLLRYILRQNDLTGKGQGEIAQTVGATSRASDNSIDDFANEFPGGMQGTGTPVSGKRMLRQLFFREPGTTINPFDIAGVGARTETKFGPAAASRHAGEWVEGVVRIAPFISLLKQGFDPQVAKRMVDHVQISYAAKNYTPFENKLLQLFPFGKFMKGEAKFVAKELTERPGGRLGQTIRATDALRGDQDRPVPPYIAGGLAIPLPSGESGAPRFLGGAGLMHEDPLSFITNPSAAVMELASRMNPLVKAPAEFATGQSFFQRGPMGGRPLEDMDPLVGRLVSNITGDEEAWRGLPTGVEMGLANSPFAPLLTHLRVATDRRKGIGAKAFNLLTGGRITDVSPGAQASLLQEALHREMKDAGGKSFTRVFFSKEDLAAMPPADRAKAVRLNALNKLLATQAKVRSDARKAASSKFLK